MPPSDPANEHLIKKGDPEPSSARSSLELAPVGGGSIGLVLFHFSVHSVAIPPQFTLTVKIKGCDVRIVRIAVRLHHSLTTMRFGVDTSPPAPHRVASVRANSIANRSCW